MARVKTNVATKVKEESAADDFSREEPHVSVGQPSACVLDTKDWEQRLRRVTALFREDPEIYLADAELSVAADNRYYVNTEGNLRVRFTDTVARRAEKKDMLSIDFLYARLVAGPPDTQPPTQTQAGTVGS